jgi:hypothetical protein
VHDRIAALLSFIGSVSNMSLLTIGGHHYYDSHGKIMENKMVTGQGFIMGIGGCNRLCPVATGHSLVALFLYPYRLKTVRCWTLIKSQSYYPEHILAYGSGKACYSLVMGFGSFQTD